MQNVGQCSVIISSVELMKAKKTVDFMHAPLVYWQTTIRLRKLSVFALMLGDVQMIQLSENGQILPALLPSLSAAHKLILK